MKVVLDTAPMTWNHNNAEHIMVAVTGGWGVLCSARPSTWQTMDEQVPDEPHVLAFDIDKVTCEDCKQCIGHRKSTWQITWVKADL